MMPVAEPEETTFWKDVTGKVWAERHEAMRANAIIALDEFLLQEGVGKGEGWSRRMFCDFLIHKKWEILRLLQIIGDKSDE